MMKTRVFELAAQCGYTDDAKLARAMGLTPATISRVKNGNRGISQVFIAGALRAFPDKAFEDLFTVDDESDLAIA